MKTKLTSFITLTNIFKYFLYELQTLKGKHEMAPDLERFTVG